MPLPLAEVHGLCCGLLCSMSSTAAKTRWFTELLDAASLSPEAVASKAGELKTLDEWFGQTLGTLNDADMDFSPALPDDDVSVQVRTRALGDFCGGYTYGIGIALSQRGHKPLPADTREIIEDFQAIEAADVDDSSTDEVVFTELLEYVRVGVLLILEELRPITPVTQLKPS
ncbi:hypothetical protein IMCC3135_29635 [Granulosicoccus antarcticus IMCC3135]|uniref:YecA family protein n=2 Tax=Granulosicoccus TaxID=437504 RepID=A0A2Z2P5K4_9GAMM|nr:UPF0149 family protein [Granulosicoccus antarcticus]ASJ75977.1 hypothetical protein IMCC3135_29635 [Granulosicoccus antarcticus IMCC3135]